MMNIKPSLSIPSAISFDFTLDDVQSLSITPKRLTDIDSWHGHIPFAFWLVKRLEPSVFVELGVHKGDSYSAFCQAVQAFSLSTACYGVDSWTGDDHAGAYAETIYQEYSRYHDQHYAGFSRLVRSTFDEALNYFADGSIDLLHIDGQHTYEDVKHDFESWLPKLSDRAIVLFHDINVREREFGVWKFFLELSQQYSGGTFSFIHSHGLGVLIVGDKTPGIIKCLGRLEDEDATFVRFVFSTFGQFIKAHATESMLRFKVEELESMLRFKVEELESALRDAISAAETAEKLRVESSVVYEEQIKSGEMERRQMEVDFYKAEFKLAHRLQEKDRLLEMLIRSRSMRLTKPLRYLTTVVRRWRR